MKFTNRIIGFLLILIIAMNVNVPVIYALTEPEKNCTEEKKILDKSYKMKIWNDAETKNQDVYEKNLNEMRMAYHDYIGCIFDFAESEILQSGGAEQSGTMAANTLNTGTIPIIGGLIDWMTPDQACLSDDKLKEIIQKTEPSQMLNPVLQAHSDYKIYLTKLGGEFNGKGVITDENGKVLTSQVDALRAKSANMGTIKRQRQLEIDSSLLAIDLMFTSLRELRLAFVMHVRFQCMLKFLDKYRKSLEDLRNVIEPLPIQLEDASTS